MVRLIDADALLKTLNKEKIPCDADVNYFIMHAPTIEERKTGKWIKDNHFLKCPICGQTQYAVEAYDWEDGEWTCFLKHCPNCGAKLEDADREETK